jgi:hypothetical protein
MASSSQQHNAAQHADAAPQVIASELGSLTTKANRSSHKLCQYALENVLLHQAAAQQLQVSVLSLACRWSG